MPLTGKQWNVVVVLHYVAMFDLLTTIVGVSMGARESNILFNHIQSVPAMFITMLAVNSAITIGIILYLHTSTMKDSIKRYLTPDIFTNALLVVCGIRLYLGPISNVLVIRGM